MAHHLPTLVPARKSQVSGICEWFIHSAAVMCLQMRCLEFYVCLLLCSLAHKTNANFAYPAGVRYATPVHYENNAVLTGATVCGY